MPPVGAEVVTQNLEGRLAELNGLEGTVVEAAPEQLAQLLEEGRVLVLLGLGQPPKH